MAQKTIDEKIDKGFPWIAIILYYSGIGVIFGLIYYLVLKYIFGKQEKLDITQGFRKQKKVKVRHPAFLISGVILIAVIIIGVYLLSFLLPLYDAKMREWLNPLTNLKI